MATTERERVTFTYPPGSHIDPREVGTLCMSVLRLDRRKHGIGGAKKHRDRGIPLNCLCPALTGAHYTTLLQGAFWSPTFVRVSPCRKC